MSPPKDPIKYEEYIKRQSESRKGKHQSEESNKKNSDSHKGKLKSEKTKQKMSEAMKNNTNGKGNKGKHASEETRKKQSKAKWKGGKKLAKAKSGAKRRRCLGFDPINESLNDDDIAHHLTENFIAYVPEFINKSVVHNIHIGKNMDEVNFYTLNYLFLVYNKEE